MHIHFLLIILAFSSTAIGQEYSLRYINTNSDASFRGLSVADQNNIWVSGSKGWVGRSTDGGEHWTFRQVPGFETCDFRSLYAFDQDNAIIANAGSPAYVLRTHDGGHSWKKVYENRDPAAFIDGIDFWEGGKSGIIHGDPIAGRMLLLRTDDSGNSWKEITGPELSEGEASFAASGTAIKCLAGERVVVATGGKVSKLYLFKNSVLSRPSIKTPILQGSEGTGIFSFMAGADGRKWYIAGGDYKHDSVRTANFFYSADKGISWQAPVVSTRGYRECLAISEGKNGYVMYAVGPSGIDISFDEGKHWRPLSDEKGFHVIKSVAGKDYLFLAGAEGKLAILRVRH